MASKQRVRAISKQEYYTIQALAALSASSLMAIFWWLMV